jgi:hypothetical protein
LLRARLTLATAVLLLAAGCGTATTSTQVVTIGTEPVAAVTPSSTTTTTPPPPGHCADYAAMEAGHGHPTNQAWFNHLDAQGYARLRSACVYGWGTAEWACLHQLWTEESSWKVAAGRPTGSYGIPQSYPGTKMATAGADWRTNPRTQVRWGLRYISERYGRPTRATMRRAPCHAGY